MIFVYQLFVLFCFVSFAACNKNDFQIKLKNYLAKICYVSGKLKTSNFKFLSKNKKLTNIFCHAHKYGLMYQQKNYLNIF